MRSKTPPQPQDSIRPVVSTTDRYNFPTKTRNPLASCDQNYFWTVNGTEYWVFSQLIFNNPPPLLFLETAMVS